MRKGERTSGWSEGNASASRRELRRHFPRSHAGTTRLVQEGMAEGGMKKKRDNEIALMLDRMLQLEQQQAEQETKHGLHLC